MCYVNGHKSIGVGLFVGAAVLILGLIDKLDTTWALAVAGVGSLLAVLDELRAGRGLYALAWVALTFGQVTGYFLWQPWGVIPGTVVGALLLAPVINRAEGRV